MNGNKGITDFNIHIIKKVFFAKPIFLCCASGLSGFVRVSVSASDSVNPFLPEKHFASR